MHELSSCPLSMCSREEDFTAIRESARAGYILALTSASSFDERGEPSERVTSSPDSLERKTWPTDCALLSLGSVSPANAATPSILLMLFYPFLPFLYIALSFIELDNVVCSAAP